MSTSSSSASPGRVTGKSLFHWALHGNLKIQLLLVTVIMAMVVFRVVPLEMQKRIINDSISLGKFDRLLFYSGIYFLAVTASAGLKLLVNYLQAVIGERAMLAMRRALYAHIIGLPLHFFRNTQPGMVVSSLMTELNTAGAFAGMAIAVPVANVLTLLAFAVYLLWLNPLLALVTLSIYPLVAFLIPWLQKKANRLNRRRVDKSREVANQIAESVTGLTEIYVHSAHRQERNKFNLLVEELRAIRTRWSLLRFGIKTVNNYFAGLGPFVVFLVGGYLIMQGELEIGSMVAFLSAQEKLYDPWKELIEYYQVYQDASVRYGRTMQYFDLEPVPLLPAPDTKEALVPEGLLEITNLVYTTALGVTLLKRVSLALRPGEHLALVGFSGSGKSSLINCIGGIVEYTGGSILLDGKEIKEFSRQELVRSIGYISQNPFIFSGTIRENLLYSHRAAYESAEGEYQPPESDLLILALQRAGFFVDVIHFGLETHLEPDATEMMDRIVRIRFQFREQFGGELEKYIEFYHQDRYLVYADIAENILFGVPADRSFIPASLARNPAFRTFLDEMELTVPLLRLGIDLIRKSLDLLAGSAEDDIAFDSLPVKPDQLDRYKGILTRLGERKPEQLDGRNRETVLELALGYSQGRWFVLPIPGRLEKMVLRARKAWNSRCPEIISAPFNFFSEPEYIQGQTILYNILQGRLKTEEAAAREEVSKSIIRLLIEEDCLEAVAEEGMEYHPGSMGNRLSGGQRQKLAIARVLLKDPKILLMDEATSALDSRSQARIQHLVEQTWGKGRTIISVVHRLDIIPGYDRVGVMKAGKLMELGTYDELIARRGLLYELVHGKK